MGAIQARTTRGRLLGVPLRALRDDRLAHLAAHGDRQAFAQIFERHHQGIYRYCASLLANADDAADALQSTMAAALRAIDGEHREIAVKPWLYRIAHNEAISLLRRRRPHAELDEWIVETTADCRDAEGSRDGLRQLVADLRDLPDRQRGALVMRELSGLGYDEIAAAFGMSAATAKQTVYEARRALHELAEGRAVPCEAIRELISANDGRLLAGRRVRAHLRACQLCRAFKEDIATRGDLLGLLAPPLAPFSASAILDGLIGSGDGGGGAGLLSLVASASGKAGVAGTSAKGLAVAALAVGTGAAGVAAGTEALPFVSERSQNAAPSVKRAPGAARLAEPSAPSGAAPLSPAGQPERDGVSGGPDGDGPVPDRDAERAGEPLPTDGRGGSGARPGPDAVAGGRPEVPQAGEGAGRTGTRPQGSVPPRPSPQATPPGSRPPQSPVTPPVAPAPQPPSAQPPAPTPQPPVSQPPAGEAAPPSQPPAPAPAPPARPPSPKAGVPTGR